MEFKVFPATQSKPAKRFYIPQGSKSLAAKLVRQMKGRCFYKGAIEPGDTIVISQSQLTKKQNSKVADAVKQGALAVYLELQPTQYNIFGRKVQVDSCGMGDRHFVSRATGHRLVNDFEPDDFRFWYDSSVGYPTPILETVLTADQWDVILQSGNGDWRSDWHNYPVGLEKRLGKGTVRISQVKLLNRLDANPVAAIFAERLLSI